MQRALQLSSLSTLNVELDVAQLFLERIYLFQERFTLSSFNCHPHIDDPAMLTYR